MARAMACFSFIKIPENKGVLETHKIVYDLLYKRKLTSHNPLVTITTRTNLSKPPSYHNNKN